MQTKKIIKILAINPGTRYIGFAVFYGPELRDWGTKVVKGSWSAKKKEKLINIVQYLIEQHQHDAIALKKLHPSRSSKPLDSFIIAIKLITEVTGSPIYEYPIRYLEACFSPGKPINKRQLAEQLARRYPVLHHELQKEKVSHYYIRMIEAVAIGTACSKQLDRS